MEITPQEHMISNAFESFQRLTKSTPDSQEHNSSNQKMRLNNNSLPTFKLDTSAGTPLTQNSGETQNDSNVDPKNDQISQNPNSKRPSLFNQSQRSANSINESNLVEIRHSEQSGNQQLSQDASPYKLHNRRSSQYEPMKQALNQSQPKIPSIPQFAVHPFSASQKSDSSTNSQHQNLQPSPPNENVDDSSFIDGLNHFDNSNYQVFQQPHQHTAQKAPRPNQHQDQVSKTCKKIWDQDEIENNLAGAMSYSVNSQPQISLSHIKNSSMIDGDNETFAQSMLGNLQSPTQQIPKQNNNVFMTSDTKELDFQPPNPSLDNAKIKVMDNFCDTHQNNDKISQQVIDLQRQAEHHKFLFKKHQAEFMRMKLNAEKIATGQAINEQNSHSEEPSYEQLSPPKIDAFKKKQPQVSNAGGSLRFNQNHQQNGLQQKLASHNQPHDQKNNLASQMTDLYVEKLMTSGEGIDQAELYGLSRPENPFSQQPPFGQSGQKGHNFVQPQHQTLSQQQLAQFHPQRFVQNNPQNQREPTNPLSSHQILSNSSAANSTMQQQQDVNFQQAPFSQTNYVLLNQPEQTSGIKNYQEVHPQLRQQNPTQQMQMNFTQSQNVPMNNVAQPQQFNNTQQMPYNRNNYPNNNSNNIVNQQNIPRNMYDNQAMNNIQNNQPRLLNDFSNQYSTQEQGSIVESNALIKLIPCDGSQEIPKQSMQQQLYNNNNMPRAPINQQQQQQNVLSPQQQWQQQNQQQRKQWPQQMGVQNTPPQNQWNQPQSQQQQQQKPIFEQQQLQQWQQQQKQQLSQNPSMQQNLQVSQQQWPQQQNSQQQYLPQQQNPMGYQNQPNNFQNGQFNPQQQPQFQQQNPQQQQLPQQQFQQQYQQTPQQQQPQRNFQPLQSVTNQPQNNFQISQRSKTPTKQSKDHFNISQTTPFQRTLNNNNNNNINPSSNSLSPIRNPKGNFTARDYSPQQNEFQKTLADMEYFDHKLPQNAQSRQQPQGGRQLGINQNYTPDRPRYNAPLSARNPSTDQFQNYNLSPRKQRQGSPVKIFGQENFDLGQNEIQTERPGTIHGYPVNRQDSYNSRTARPMQQNQMTRNSSPFQSNQTEVQDQTTTQPPRPEFNYNKSIGGDESVNCSFDSELPRRELNGSRVLNGTLTNMDLVNTGRFHKEAFKQSDTLENQLRKEIQDLNKGLNWEKENGNKGGGLSKSEGNKNKYYQNYQGQSSNGNRQPLASSTENIISQFENVHKGFVGSSSAVAKKTASSNSSAHSSVQKKVLSSDRFQQQKQMGNNNISTNFEKVNKPGLQFKPCTTRMSKIQSNNVGQKLSLQSYKDMEDVADNF